MPAANASSSVYQVPTQDQIFAELQRLNLYKPPPPYPGTNANGQQGLQQGYAQMNGTETRMISSTSTPDLASTNIMSAMNATHSGVLLGKLMRHFVLSASCLCSLQLLA